MSDQDLLMSELRDSGFDVPALSVLRDSGKRYTAAIPALVRWLPTSDLLLKEHVARALSYPWAKSALPHLIREFESLPTEGSGPLTSVRWAIGNAIETTWDDAYFEDLSRIASERSYGRARQMVVLGFGKSKRHEAVPLLVSLLDDQDISGHATSALARLAPAEATQRLEKMLDDDRAWVRKEAQRGLAKIHKH